jgi:L-threonylcarbamoyladenylate synthase
LQEAASKLYDALHQLDHENLDIIIVEKMPDLGLGKSMNDRLQRAAYQE